MTTKKIIGGVLVIAVLGVAYYALSPLFRNVEVHDELPMAISNNESQEQTVLGTVQEETGEKHSSPTEPSKKMLEDNEMAFPVMQTTGHPAEGSVRIIETVEGTVIRFENFKTINGPNLHLYLAKDLDADEFIDLGPIRGTEGNINYVVPDGVDVSEYKYVMHWCVPFSVLFNYAEIN